MAESKEKFNVKQVITEEIIKSLEEAGGVWHKDWRSMGVPMNADSNKPYRGINFLILSLTGMAKGYKSNKWITYKNMQKQGGELLPTGLLDENEKEVKQKTTMITFYSPLTVKDKASGLDKSIPMLKYYRVFNIEQTTLRDSEKFTDKMNVLDPALMNAGVDKLIGSFDCPIDYMVGDKACYTPSKDRITMPVTEQFVNYHAYYATMLHEMAHATGHEKRLNRFKLTEEFFKNKSENYAFEELVAELTSMFLLASNSIDNEAIKDNGKQYIKSWLKGLKSNPDFIFKASSYAQKAFEYIDKSQAYTKVEELQAV